jgi:outer membrane lipoprotein SlyB
MRFGAQLPSCIAASPHTAPLPEMTIRPSLPCPLVRSALLLTLLLACTEAQAAPLKLPEFDNGPESRTTVAPVLFVYASQNRDRSVGEQCWDTLISQRDLAIREDNAKPFFVRNLFPLVGAAMGGIAGGWMLKRLASDAVARKWMLPVVAGSGLGGYFAGPGGVAGALVGGGIADKLGKHDRFKKTLPGALAGALVGKALWDAAFPPAVPPAPPSDPDGEIAPETFVRDKTCGPQLLMSHEDSLYRIGYRFNGEEYTVDVPFDPGEAVLLDPTGKAVGPARERVE